MTRDFNAIMEDSQRVLDIIAKDKLEGKEMEDYVAETTENFAEYFNPGFLEYRKSASTNFTAVEWRDNGDVFEDLHGNEYIDCLGGYGIYNVGHKHPKVVEAVTNQLKRQALHSQELLDPLRGNLAKLLAKVTPGDLKYSFFCNSGTEAVECALKVAMLATGKHTIIATTGAFHGKSLGSLSCTSKFVFRKPFLPLLQGVKHVPYNDLDCMEKMIQSCQFTGEDAAAIIVEPIQGEGGVLVPDDDYLPGLRKLCDKYDVLLIADEVQTGMGRTGKFWCCDHWDVTPDLLCTAKAFGGAVMPAGACVGTEKVWKAMMPNPFLHTTTFGGNPLACAAAIATINVLLEDKLVERAATVGEDFIKRLDGVAKKYPQHAVEARGKGFLIAMEFVDGEKGYMVAKSLFSQGVIVAGTLINAKTIRVEPPTTISQEHMDAVVAAFDKALASLDVAEAAATNA